MIRMIWLSLLLSCALGASARADFAAHQCVAPTTGPVRAIEKSNACTGYRVERAGKTVTSVAFPFLGSGTLLASADGRTVVMIQSYLSAVIDDAGEVSELVTSTVNGKPTAKHVTNPIAVYVYRDGKPIAQHHINDLVDRGTPRDAAKRKLHRQHLVEESISHVRWVGKMPATIGKTFEITTTSFRTITFDATTGAITKQADAPVWKRCDAIVSGKLDVAAGRVKKAYAWKQAAVVGDVPFTRGRVASLTEGEWGTYCLEQGELTERLRP